MELYAYSNVDYDNDPTNRKSITGFCIFLGDYLISWKSKKQSIACLTSTEAEYCDMDSITKEIVWLHWLLADMRVFLSHPTLMYCDNKSAIQIAHNSVFHEQTKHIEIDCHLTRQHLKHGTITLPFVSSSLQLAPFVSSSLKIADFFTKLCYVFRFHFLVGKLSMLVADTS